jgi:methionine synthase II (cobalamin-independent)
MKKASQSAGDLKKLIKQAIEDLEVTPTEYQQIMDCALADGHIDKEEQALLTQFQTMIANGTVKRVKG